MNNSQESIMRNVLIPLLPLLLLTIFISCLSESRQQPEELPAARPFYLGFTPWPYAATPKAVNDVYNFINREGDLVAHHLQQGIPFNVLDRREISTYPSHIREEIEGAIGATERGKAIYLAIDSLNGARDDLAGLWESAEQMARPAPWDEMSFDSPEVIAAYIDYSTAVIEKFRSDYGAVPTYFNYATEISELMLNSPERYKRFPIFARGVYESLKKSYPSMRIAVSIALKSPGSAEMLKVKEGFARISSYVDLVGVSSYAYAFYDHPGRENPANLPPDWLSQIKEIAPGQSYAVTETGWIAQELTIPDYSLKLKSNESYQNSYLKRLFKESSENLNCEFIIWYCSYDFDKLWRDHLGSDSLAAIWRDSGLIDEKLKERPALATWRAWMKLKRQR